MQPSLDLAALASHEQVDAIMLLRYDLEEGVPERPLGAFALSRNRYGFVRARRRLVLDEVFEVIVVDVICSCRPISACLEVLSCDVPRYLQWPHSGIDLKLRVSPYFMPTN
jgi:hypothetical protein